MHLTTLNFNDTKTLSHSSNTAEPRHHAHFHSHGNTPAHNKQETQLTATPLSQAHYHQLGLPLQQVILSELHSNELLLSPLHTINPRKKKKSTIKREKFGMHAPSMKHSRSWAARALMQKSHFSKLPSAAVQIVEQGTAQCADNYLIHGKRTSSALGTSS